MRGIIFLFLLTFLVFHTAFAYEDLGKLHTAMKKYPLIFKPHHIQQIEIKGVSGFTFTGESEQFFDGDMAEPESELYREATRDAHNFLYLYFTKGNSKKTVQMSGVQLLYQYAEGDKRRVVYFVPANQLHIQAKSAHQHTDRGRTAIPDINKLFSHPALSEGNMNPTNHTGKTQTNQNHKAPANSFPSNNPFPFLQKKK